MFFLWASNIFRIIDCSFIWPDEKFGLPRTPPGIFILAAYLDLLAILGYIVFVNFLPFLSLPSMIFIYSGTTDFIILLKV